MTQIPVLPTGFALPSMWALVGIAGLAALVGGLLYRRSPPVTSATIGGLAPWMVAGASGYVLYQIDAVPVAVRPLLGAPLVYVTTAILAALVWMAVSWVADHWRRSDSRRSGWRSPASLWGPVCGRRLGTEAYLSSGLGWGC